MQNTANVTKRTTEWHNVNWRKATRTVRGLRRRIFKATEEGNWRKVRNLQRMMLRCYSNALLSVRKATQDNKGRKTAGVDKILVKTPQARGKMVDDIINSQDWKPKPARRLITEWLKAGYIDKNVFHPQENGTPQGGIISPLLANIALHGMEEHLGVKYNYRGESQGKRIIVRYADDFVILCESKEDAEKAKDEMGSWLRNRGLELSPEKTKIVHLTEGFDFLGFNIRHYKVSNTKTGYKLLIKPSKEFVKRTRKDIREIFLKHHGKPVSTLIGKINPVIRGKANYMNKVVSSETFASLDTYLFIRQKRYVKRYHPTKSKKWRKRKYWGRLNLQRPNNKWVFGDKTNGNYMLMFNWTKIERHAIVSQRSSPDDPKLKDYWAKRQNKSDRTKAQKLSRIDQRVATKQGYKCPICGESIFNDEPLHRHHKIPRCQGGKDEVKNLVWLHLYCHHQVHYQQK